MYTHGQMRMCIPVSPAEKPNPNTMEPYSPQYDNPTTYVIAQLYSSAPPLPHCAFIPTRENSECFPFFFYCVSLKLHKLGGTSTYVFKQNAKQIKPKLNSLWRSSSLLHIQVTCVHASVSAEYGTWPLSIQCASTTDARERLVGHYYHFILDCVVYCPYL